MWNPCEHPGLAWVFLAIRLSLDSSDFEEHVAGIPESPQSSLGVPIVRMTSRVRETIRSLVTAERELDIDLASSATINAQFWLNRFPWRPTAGWAVVAALLSVGVLKGAVPLDWGTLALLWLLVDPLWGSIWRLAGGRTEVLPLRARDLEHEVWLPYIQPGSPAELILGRGGRGAMHLVFRVGVPTVALATGIALVLGPSAAWFTLVLLVLSALGWISRHTLGVVPAMLHSLVTIVLPWFLALYLFGVTAENELWRAVAVLVLLWFLHNWGETRILRSASDVAGIALLAIADAGIALLLIGARSPIWLAILAVMWLPTWLAIYRRQPMLRLNFWWLAAMLVSAAAVGQRIEF